MHIQNPAIFRIRDIFRTLSRHILAYSERSVTLAYWEPCHNFTYFWPEVYSELCQTSKMEEINWRVIILPRTPNLFSDKVLNTTLSQEVLKTLYSDLGLCTISAIVRTLAYSKLCLFRHIQAYSIIIVIITLTFFFSLTYFSTKFKACVRYFLSNFYFFTKW